MSDHPPEPEDTAKKPSSEETDPPREGEAQAEEGAEQGVPAESDAAGQTAEEEEDWGDAPTRQMQAFDGPDFD